jgi:predicted Zn-dependent protease with MMP-like domain
MERRMDCTDWTAPGLGEIEALADAALLLLPQPYQAAARDLVIRIEDFAPRRILLDMGVEDPFELTGLYDGIPADREIRRRSARAAGHDLAVPSPDAG